MILCSAHLMAYMLFTMLLYRKLIVKNESISQKSFLKICFEWRIWIQLTEYWQRTIKNCQDFCFRQIVPDHDFYSMNTWWFTCHSLCHHRRIWSLIANHLAKIVLMSDKYEVHNVKTNRIILTVYSPWMIFKKSLICLKALIFHWAQMTRNYYYPKIVCLYVLFSMFSQVKTPWISTDILFCIQYN